MKCPRAFMFHALTYSKTADRLEFGIVLHAYAQLYACYRELVRAKGVDFFLDAASDHYSGMSSPLRSDYDRQRLRCGMVRMERLIDSLDIHPELDADVKEGENMFFDMLDPPLRRGSSLCESEHESKIHPIMGKMDLLTGGPILDYKSGKSKAGKDIAKNLDRGKVQRESDYQALIYVAIASELGIATDEFDLFYAMEDEDLYLAEGCNIGEHIRKVHVRDIPLIDFCNDPLVENAFCSTLSWNSKILKDPTGFIQMVLERHGEDYPEWTGDEDLIDALDEKFGAARTSLVNAVKSLQYIVQSGIAWGDGDVMVRREALNGFLRTLEDDYETVKEQYVSGFPCTPMVDCKKCDYRKFCTRDIATSEDESDE